MKTYLKRMMFGYLYGARLAWWQVALAKLWMLRCRVVGTLRARGWYPC